MFSPKARTVPHKEVRWEDLVKHYTSVDPEVEEAAQSVQSARKTNIAPDTYEGGLGPCAAGRSDFLKGCEFAGSADATSRGRDGKISSRSTHP